MVAVFVEVWQALVQFLVGIFPTVTEFFVETSAEGTFSLTFAGVMAVVMAGISLVLLVFNLIRSFLPMRG